MSDSNGRPVFQAWEEVRSHSQELLDVLFEDEQLIVCKKAPGLPVQSARLGVVSAESLLRRHLSTQPGAALGIVQRLDQPVQGLIVFAKTPEAASKLSKQLQSGTLKKRYLAVCRLSGQGSDEEKERCGEWHTLTDYLLRDGRTNCSSVVASDEPGAKRAELSYCIDEYQNGYALVRIRLKTGRHHQIRVQLAHAGMPIVGDRKYGAEGGGLCLCSYELAFHHPQTGKPMQFSLASEPLVEVIRKELFQLAEPEYQKFHSGLLPGVDHILGVRVPKLRVLARKVARADWRAYVRVEPETYEECMIQGMAIGYASMSVKERMKFLDLFVPRINNWAVCDCCTSTYKFMSEHLDQWYDYLLKQLSAGTEYRIRFAVVALMDYYVNDEWIDDVLRIYSSIEHEGYYVKMAVAWGVSVCYIRYPEKTGLLLSDNRLDVFTHNKAIQKIRESRRISREEKERVNGWKR